MSSTAQIQSLLRFLSQDAKVPLAQAMPKVKELQKANLLNPEQISKADTATLQDVFKDEKITKQVLNAAKRVSKKRTANGDETSSPSKRSRKVEPVSEASPSEFESSLSLPILNDVDEISKTVVVTNRAPLVLAFAVTLLRYTMPEQPPSSRLSLGQAVVSANSQTKARSLGLATGKSAEEEGWAKGQPKVTILGRDISVLKRIGYSWSEESESEGPAGIDGVAREESQNIDVVESKTARSNDDSPPLWGLDLEALRRSDNPVAGTRPGQSAILRIHRPESARDYLLKSFDLYTAPEDSPKSKKKTKKTPSGIQAEKDKALGLLLGAIDLLCKSWASTLDSSELDRRAWAWYVKVRPDVQNGVHGWGQKGQVPLSEILALRR